MKKILIIIPTYNEVNNIKMLINDIFKYVKNFDLLFIDDNSPDKTSGIIKNFQLKKKNIFLFSRKKKSGIGSAHKLGLNWGFKKKYKKIITMDGDGTHHPKYLKKMLKKSNKSHLIITNRFLKKNSLYGWSLTRIFITNLRHFLIKILLGFSYDASGALRCYNTSKINIKYINEAKDNGYSFFWESLYIFHKKNFIIKEIPITLPSRSTGSSKMKISDIFYALFYLIKIFYKNNK